MTQENSKISLRKDLRKRLALLSPIRKMEASLEASAFLIKHLEASSFKVLSFASRPFEINLWPLNHWLIKHQRLVLPKTEGEQIFFYEVNDVQNLRLSSFGIQEPCESRCKKVEDLQSCELILVPGLGFDKHGGRIGLGKGHYDRFLATISKTTWGIGYKEQLCDKIPQEAHDQVLDKVLFF